MSDLRAQARALYAVAIAAVEPQSAVRAQLQVHGDTLHAGPHRVALEGRVVVIGVGKASAAMALGVEAVLERRITSGVVVTKYGHGVTLARLRLIESGHPVPDAAGLHAATAVEEAVRDLAAEDLVIVCLSGGASALLPAPRPPLSLEDKQAVSRLLLACGADIGAINTVRKKLSRLKGGMLAARCAPARVLTLAISDVIGDDWSVIGSGPTSPDPTTFADAHAVLAGFDLIERLPPAVRDLLERGMAGQEADTPKPGDPCFKRVTHLLLASNRQALDAVQQGAQALGYEVVRQERPLEGEASICARSFAEDLLARRRKGRRLCLLAGGETTVVLGADHGRGGRNQEFALAAALRISGRRQVAILAAGTDGTDGPTDAAGGLVDGGSVGRASAQGLRADHALTGHDAYPLLRATEDLLISGPTGTNVMDLAIGLAEGLDGVETVPNLG